MVDAWRDPFDPGNGRSAERTSLDEPTFVRAQCATEQQASPGGPNCSAREGDPRACTGIEDCQPGLRCLGIPRDGSGELGRCWDLSNREGEGDECDAHADCVDGLVCMGITVFPGSEFCIAEDHHGIYENNDRLAILDGDDEGRTSTLVVYGLGSVPGDIVVLLDVDHPAPEQLRFELASPSGDGGVFFDGAEDAVELLGAGFAILSIPRDDEVNGRYTLRMVDTVAGDRGHLNGWTLDIIINWD